ncbi:hypothetical protein ABK040_001457 [Willaertia magna]
MSLILVIKKVNNILKELFITDCFFLNYILKKKEENEEKSIFEPKIEFINEENSEIEELKEEEFLEERELLEMEEELLENEEIKKKKEMNFEEVIEIEVNEKEDERASEKEENELLMNEVKKILKLIH